MITKCGALPNEMDVNMPSGPVAQLAGSGARNLEKRLVIAACKLKTVPVRTRIVNAYAYI